MSDCDSFSIKSHSCVAGTESSEVLIDVVGFCHCRYGTLVLTRLWYVITSAGTVVVGSKWIDKLAILILGCSGVVGTGEMPSLLIKADICLHGLVLIHWIEDKSSVFHKLL